jgi:CRP-like cAMP-binding protein
MAQPHDNWLLLSLPEIDQARLREELQRVRLEKGRPLFRQGEKAEYAYFPVDCLVSTVFTTPRTGAAEIAVTGREGVVGLEALLNDIVIPRMAVVHTTGSALRIPAEILMQACAESRALRETFTRYMQALVSQMMQISICNRHHDLQQQFCRLLLSRLDRVADDEVEISHDLLANALGTSIENVTRIAMEFWSDGLIDQEAGHIRVMDRDSLEARACDCYHMVREQYDRLLPGWCMSGKREGRARESIFVGSLPGMDGFAELEMEEAAGE